MALMVLAPAAAVVRAVRAWRRGSAIRVRAAAPTAAGSSGLLLLPVDVDTPTTGEARVRRALTDLVVRVAEQLRAEGDGYHLIRRESGHQQTSVTAVGAAPHALGERLFLSLGRSASEARTALWLVLPGGRAVAEVLDPMAYDPDAAGEPARLVTAAAVRWAAATAFVRNPPVTLYRLALWVPAAAVGPVQGLVGDVTSQLHGGS
jgi:hypothetical protein